MKKFYPKYSGTTKKQLLVLIKEMYRDINVKCPPIVAENLSDKDCQSFVDDEHKLRDHFDSEEAFKMQRQMLATILVRKTVARLKRGGLL